MAKRSRRDNSPPARPLPGRRKTAPGPPFSPQIGNQTAGRLIQAKLKIDQPGDRYESEADQVADRIVQQGNAGPSSSAVIQRQAAPETEPAPASPAGAQGALIVDDDAQQIGSGQMRKSEFLSRLKTEVCRDSEDAMKGTGRTTEGCPYVEKWFGYYAEKDSRYVERSLKKYAPEAAGATSASDYIPLVAARVRRSVEVWAQTGEITGVPDELAGAVMGGEILGSIGGVLSGIGSVIGSVVSGIVSGIGSIVSGIGRLLFKGKDGGAIPAGDARSATDGLNGGHSLDSGVRQRMETAFGRDFSAVRTHTDSRAAETSSAMNARAFTVGSEIVFSPGEYQPGTMIGEVLIAHELAHVVQQSGAGPHETLQQKGDEGTGALEEDADMSAVKAIGSSWFGRDSGSFGFGADVLPKIRSGLKLQRCPKPKPPPLNLFAPEFGPTKAQALQEAEAIKQGKERFAQNPNTYDPDFVPDVTVVLKEETYCYNFRYQDVDDVCLPPEPGTAGCVMVKSPPFEIDVDVQQQQQQLAADQINSPLSVKVTTFPVKFTAYVETDKINENQPLTKNSTMNEELQHIVDDFNLMQTYKEVLARAIRMRLVQARQQAAKNPKMADALIGKKAIEKIANEEETKLSTSLSVQRGLNTKSVHERVEKGALAVVTLPAAFQMPPVKIGAAGSLTGDDKACR